MNTQILIPAVGAIGFFGIMLFRDMRKRKNSSDKPVARRKVTPSLQDFLPIEKFHPSGAMVVNGKYRKQVRVGDLNLYSLSLEEVVSVRERFKEMLKRLDNPFQISVQARRANYTDFVKYSDEVLARTAKEYDNPSFTNYSMKLMQFLKAEAAKPRTDRENILVIGVLPKIGGEDEKVQLERLEREQAFVEGGLRQMGLPHRVLGPIDQVEAIQNFWNRERAVSQRYRDAYEHQVHTPTVTGLEVEVSDIARQKEA